jgi:hypothetical protein
MPPSDLGNDPARSKRLPNYPRLKVLSELAPPTSSRDHLQPAKGHHFRLKLMVKRRHKPISDSESSTLNPSPIFHRLKRRGQNSACGGFVWGGV